MAQQITTNVSIRKCIAPPRWIIDKQKLLIVVEAVYLKKKTGDDDPKSKKK